MISLIFKFDNTFLDLFRQLLRHYMYVTDLPYESSDFVTPHEWGRRGRLRQKTQFL